jgi:branched-chain amino acid transport system permease protein
MSIIPQLIVNSLISGSIYALAASGLSLIYGLLRILKFSHGHILMCGAYCYYYATVELQLGILPASLMSLLFTAILAAISLKVFILPFLDFNPLLVFVTTLTLSTILESAVSMIFGVNVKSLVLGSDYQSLQFGSIYITPIQIIIILSAVFLLSLIALFIHRTVPGRFIRALSENPFAGQSIGINNHVIYYGIVILGSVLATYAGVLIAYETNLQPLMGNSYTIKAFAAMILGGLGNFWGTIIASFILGATENFAIGLDFGQYSLPAGYKDAFAFLIILLILLFKPRGLFSGSQRKV